MWSQILCIFNADLEVFMALWTFFTYANCSSSSLCIPACTGVQPEAITSQFPDIWILDYKPEEIRPKWVVFIYSRLFPGVSKAIWLLLWIAVCEAIRDALTREAGGLVLVVKLVLVNQPFMCHTDVMMSETHQTVWL